MYIAGIVFNQIARQAGCLIGTPDSEQGNTT